MSVHRGLKHARPFLMVRRTLGSAPALRNVTQLLAPEPDAGDAVVIFNREDEDLSVAESNATSAIAVRHEIVLKVQQGESDTAILTSLEDSYGTSILLSPSTSGIGSLLWVLPVIIVIVGVGAYLRLVRRK